MQDETDGQVPAPAEGVQAPEAVQVEHEQQVEATATEHEDHGDEATAQPEGERKPSRGLQKRLDELTRQRYEAEGRAAALEQQLRELSRQPSPPPETRAQPEAVPTLEAFGYDEGAFQQASLEWAIKQAERSVETAFERREREAQERAKAQTFEAKINEARGKIPDFDEVLDVSRVQFTPEQLAIFQSLPDGVDVAYNLAKTPSEVARIASLPPVLQAVEIGRLSARAAASQPKPNPPAPPRTVGGVNAGPVQKSPAEMTMAEYVKWRAQAT